MVNTIYNRFKGDEFAVFAFIWSHRQPPLFLEHYQYLVAGADHQAGIPRRADALSRLHGCRSRP
jgi:hypothetical protein